MVESYLQKLQGKLEVIDYIPRNELLERLASMDFLVNFDNNTSVQLPSKLIDYAVVGRPVLNISHKFNGEHVKEFIRRDYSKQMQLPDPIKYHIRNISKLFITLFNILILLVTCK